MDEYIVYVRTDGRGVITAVNSSAFTDGIGWTEIDCGYGDRYAHAQGNYLSHPIMDEDGIYGYKLVDGSVTERTEEEKEAERTALSELERNRPASAYEIGEAILNALNN